MDLPIEIKDENEELLINKYRYEPYFGDTYYVEFRRYDHRDVYKASMGPFKTQEDARHEIRKLIGELNYKKGFKFPANFGSAFNQIRIKNRNIELELTLCGHGWLSGHGNLCSMNAGCYCYDLTCNRELLHLHGVAAGIIRLWGI